MEEIYNVHKLASCIQRIKVDKKMVDLDVCILTIRIIKKGMKSKQIRDVEKIEIS